MFKVFAYLTKRSDLSPEAFIDYYESRHIPLVLSLAPMPKVYKRNYIVRGDDANREDPSIDFDVVTELGWDDRSGFREWVTRLGVEQIAADEARFLDRGKTRACAIDERISTPE
jgi:hypothetical protein